MTNTEFDEAQKDITDHAWELRKAGIDLARKKIELMGLQNGVDLAKARLLNEAYDKKDAEGKQLYKNEAQREAYVTLQLKDEQVYHTFLDTKSKTMELEAQFTALDYEFKAKKAVMNFMTARINNDFV